MPDELRVALAFGCAFGIALITVPAARRLAFATDFLDHPRDYKEHADPTPYLGGAGVIAAFLVAGAALGSGMPKFATVISMTLFLAVIGALDDRRNLGPGLRLGAQLLAGSALWLADVRWEVFGIAALDLTLTLIWVAGLANAFNLLDNIDGAAATTASVSAAGIGAIALAEGSGELAAVAFALSGACAAFLIFNLARPARIFLGDGGSVPLGFLIAALALLLPTSLGSEALLAAVPLAGVAIFDTLLVVLSRTRRGVPVLTGGRDHSTHRLLGRVGTPRRVAMILAATQAALCVLAYGAYNLSVEGVAWVAVAYIVLGSIMLALFEGPTLAQEPAEQPT